MSTVKMVIPTAELRAIDRKIAGLSGIEQSKVLLAGMRAAGRAVRTRAKELAPHGKQEDRQGRAALRSTPAYKITAFVRRNEPVLEVRVKAAKRAPHLHLVELGHDIVKGGTVPRKQGGKTPQAIDPSKTGKGRVVGRVAGRPFLSRGGKYSEPQQRAEMNKAIVKAIKKLIGG